MTDQTDAVRRLVEQAVIYEEYGFCDEPAEVDDAKTEEMREAVRALLADRDALAAEVARLREDKARLDWLEEVTRKNHDGPELVFNPAGEEPGEYGVPLSSWPDDFSIYGCDSDYRGATLRAALDAARTPTDQRTDG